ncbi:MAG TPA: hypothetical protein VEB59_08810 [Gemmatimonadales bacterium]|nr:hypothetical protein [Gemmatimonadales bacterium]
MLTVPRGGDERTEARTVEALGLDPAGVEAHCFRCGDRVVHPAVLWFGMVGDPLYLHGACAADLARGLHLDVLRLRSLGPEPAALPATTDPSHEEV